MKFPCTWRQQLNTLGTLLGDFRRIFRAVIELHAIAIVCFVAARNNRLLRQSGNFSLSLSLSYPVEISAQKYTFAKSTMAGRSGMSMNRNPCSPLDDPPRSPSRPIPSLPPFLFLSISALSTKAARDFQIRAAQREQSNHCLHDRVIVVVVDPHLDGMIMQTPKFDRGIFSHEERDARRSADPEIVAPATTEGRIRRNTTVLNYLIKKR